MDAACSKKGSALPLYCLLSYPTYCFTVTDEESHPQRNHNSVQIYRYPLPESHHWHSLSLHFLFPHTLLPGLIRICATDHSRIDILPAYVPEKALATLASILPAWTYADDCRLYKYCFRPAHRETGQRLRHLHMQIRNIPAVQCAPAYLQAALCPEIHFLYHHSKCTVCCNANSL